MSDDTIIRFDPKRPRTNLPVIQIAPESYAELAEAAESALLLSGLPVFRRGNRLVTPAVREVTGADELPTVTAVLADINASYLREFMGRSARYEIFSIRKNRWIPCQPPKEIAELVLSRSPQWRFPEINGILVSPTLDPGGALVDRPGFNERTRLFLAELPLLPRLVDQPDKAAALAALADLEALLTEFPFVDEVPVATEPNRKTSPSRSVALSAMITLVCRGAIPLAPAHAMSAPTPGSGKSYLFDIASTIATGRPCPVITPGRRDEETEKRIGGVVLGGQACVSLDNIDGLLVSPLLCQVLERPRVLVRLLGTSTLAEAEVRTTWFCTGTNLAVADDLTRRVLIGQIDSGWERPELRTFANDPVAAVMRERGRYIGACLTILRAYIAAGRPGRLTPLASYGPWSNLVRSALCWLGCADPCDTIKAARDNDPTLQERLAVYAAWPLGEPHYTVAQLIELAEKDAAAANLKPVLMQIASVKGAIDPTALGKWFSRNKNRVAGGMVLTREGTTAGRSQWAVRKTETTRTG